MFAAQAAMWAARDAAPGSPEWIRARDAVERADEASRPARAAFSALILFYSQSVERTHGAETDFVVLARHVTEESLLGMTEHLLEQLERIARILPEHPQPFDTRETN